MFSRIVREFLLNEISHPGGANEVAGLQRYNLDDPKIGTCHSYLLSYQVAEISRG